MYKLVVAEGLEALENVLTVINAEGGEIEHALQDGNRYTLIMHYGRWVRATDDEGNEVLRCSECGCDFMAGDDPEGLWRCQWCLSPMEEIELEDEGEDNDG